MSQDSRLSDSGPGQCWREWTWVKQDPGLSDPSRIPTSLPKEQRNRKTDSSHLVSVYYREGKPILLPLPGPQRDSHHESIMSAPITSGPGWGVRLLLHTGLQGAITDQLELARKVDPFAITGLLSAKCFINLSCSSHDKSRR